MLKILQVQSHQGDAGAQDPGGINQLFTEQGLDFDLYWEEQISESG
jgi:hypothetical protein